MTLSRLILMSAAIFIDSVSGGVVPDAELYVLSLANKAMSVVCVNAGVSAMLPQDQRCSFKMAAGLEQHAV